MKLYKLYIAAFCLLTFSSCKKLLETQETDLIAGAIALKTVNNCEQGIIGAYAGVNVDMGILLNSTFSDEVKPGEFYNAQTTHEWAYGSTDVGIRDNFTAINGLYQIIDRVNRVLLALPTADSTRTGDLVLKGKLRGEGLFLRAYANFDLFRYYSAVYDPAAMGLPYVETPSLSGSARTNLGTIFQKMSADLVEAKALVPNNTSDINRATRIAVSALQARIALYTKDWANAVTYSTEFINTLPLAPIASFGNIWKDSVATEVGFRIVKTVVASRLGSLYRATSSSAAATNISSVSWIPSNKLYMSYDSVKDVRFAAYIKYEPTLAAAGRPGRLIQKYAGGGYGTPTENVNNGKIFRTGEMYLIRAEARAELGTFTGANSAETDLNALRTARINGYANVTLASKDAAITEILQERFKELPFEGHRFWDLKRRGLPVARLASDAPSATGTTLAAGNFRFALPIPDAEIKANKLMTQNPGY